MPDGVLITPWKRSRVARVTGDHMSVWHIREFLRYVDEAGIPDKTWVKAEFGFGETSGRFQGLTVTVTDEQTDGTEK